MTARYEVKSGVEVPTNDHAQEVISKVIEKIVRVEVSDGRVFIGKLMSVD